MWITRQRLSLAVIAFALTAAACSGGSDEVAEPSIAPDVDTILATAADVMGSVDAVRFTIELEGADVFIDLGEDVGDLIQFRSADGFFVGPTSAEAVVTVTIADFNTRIGAVAIDGQIWLALVANLWQPAPASFTFDPASLFDPSQGFRKLFTDGLADVTLIGPEDRDGIATYHIRGTASEERVEVLTAGLTRNQSVDIDVWLDQSLGRIVDAAFSTTVTAGTANWTMTFREYGADVTIDPPDLGAGG